MLLVMLNSGDVSGRYSPAWSWYEACIFRRMDTGSVDVQDAAIDWEQIQDGDYRTSEDAEKELASGGWQMIRNGDGQCVWRVQSNCVARRDYETFTVTWTSKVVEDELEAEARAKHGTGDGRGFVKALQPGDRVGLWMRAQYPGWANYLREAKIEVQWAVR